MKAFLKQPHQSWLVYYHNRCVKSDVIVKQPRGMRGRTWIRLLNRLRKYNGFPPVPYVPPPPKTSIQKRVVAFYNLRGTAEQWIKEGKNAVKWTRLSCCSFAANAVRLQLHALAYNLANFMRTLALPEAVKQWSLTSLREKLVKIGAKVVCHGRYVIFQMAEVAVPKELFQEVLRLIDGLRPRPAPA
jgi:hypothetical protein